MAEITRDTLVDGRYRVVSRLGTGGMADVFLVEDEQLGRKVALKLLHRRFAEDPAFVERFRREAQAAAGLQHPNIVSVYDRGEYDGTYYIAMEYLPGRTLKQVIHEEAPLDAVRAIDIAIQILKAARFAHRRGIIHRDLKPHNVIVDDAGQAKVTDFGIARAGASDMTETGSIMGTAQYLSPEQAQGHSVTASSDLYSVGVVLYEMLTGRVPFDGEAAVTIALKHVSEAPIPPRSLNPAVPPELEQTILWTLNKNAADRPQDADQLITVLEHCRRAIIAGAAGQHTASMAAVAAGAAAGMPVDPDHPLPEVPAAPEPSTNGSGQIPVVADETGEPEPPRRGWGPWLWGVLAVLLIAAAAAAAYFLSRPKTVAVPAVTGLQLSNARTILQNAGFQVPASPTQVPNAKPAGTVISETPKGGSRADKGSAITLTVSKGQGNVLIPSVQGESKATAIRQLKRAGLKVSRVAAQPSSRFPPGQATSTSPAAAKSVPHGTPVTLFVSSGTPSKVVPPVVGDSEASASSTLRRAGFDVNPQTKQSSTASPGSVISESPGANTSAPQGSTVTIVVASAPATVTVPPVGGDPASGAVSALQSAGFTVVRETRPVTDQSRAGTVVAQSPSGGSSRPKGSSVTIAIGSYRGTTTPTTSTPTSPTTTTTTTTTTKTSSTTKSTPTSPPTPTSPTTP